MQTRKGWRLLFVGAMVCAVVSAAQGATMYTKDLTGFETSEGYNTSDEVIWQEPEYAQQTVRSDVGSPGIEPDGIHEGDDPFYFVPWSQARVTDYAAATGSQAYNFDFVWGNPPDTDLTGYPEGDPDTSINDMVRCYTGGGVANLNRPSVHLDGKITFKMLVLGYKNEYFQNPTPDTPKIRMCLAIRETGTDVPQGETDTGGGDIEWVYPVGTTTGDIPADTNGALPSLPGTRNYATTPPGGKLYSSHYSAFDGSSYTDVIPGWWEDVEFDLSTALLRGFFNSGTIQTAGDGLLDAATWGVGDGVNRGMLDSIVFTNDSGDAVGKHFVIFIDDVKLVSPDPDPLSPPSIQSPVFTTTSTVLVNKCHKYATEAELFVNDISAGETTTFTGTDPKVAVFPKSLHYPGGLSAGDVLRATHSIDATTSGLSAPVIVFGPGTLIGDNFDNYADQEEMNLNWKPSINYPSPSYARLRLEQGGAASCENLLLEENPPNSDAARLRNGPDIAFNTNGTDAKPLWLTFYFKQSIVHTNARTRIQLARFDNGAWSVSNPYQKVNEGTTGFALFNGIGNASPNSGPVIKGDYFFDQYLIQLTSYDSDHVNTTGAEDVGTNGFVAGYDGYRYALTGVPRDAGVWHKMQVEVKTDVFNYYIDDVKCNPVDTNGDPIAKWAGGVSRPSEYNGKDPYQFIIFGQGYSNNGPALSYDNVSLTVGATGLPFPAPNPVSPPSIVGLVLPGMDELDLENVNSNATTLTVYRNGSAIGTDTEGYYPDNIATVGVSALSVGDVLYVTQVDTNGAGGTVESCISSAVTVAIPAPTLLGPLLPNDTAVTVTDLLLSSTRVAVLVDGSTVGFANATGVTQYDVSVSPPLAVGDTVTATQLIGGVESPPSNAITLVAQFCHVLYSSDMSSGTGWNSLPFSADDTATWGYDYSLMGLSAPPGGSDTIGLRLEANTTDGAKGTITVYSDGTYSGKYQLQFDVWGNYLNLGGTSEFFGGGIGHDKTTITAPNQGTGSGGWLCMTTDGFSARDYRMYKDAGEQWVASTQYNTGAGGMVTNNHSDAYFASIAPQVDLTTFDPPQTGQTGVARTGEPGFNWHHVVITVDEAAGTARFDIGSVWLGTISTGIGSSFPTTGALSFFHSDNYASLNAFAFSIYDNVLVTKKHTPGAEGDWDGDADFDLADYWYLADCMSGPDGVPDPITGSGCAGACLDVFDFDSNGTVDLDDFGAFQEVFGT